MIDLPSCFLTEIIRKTVSLRTTSRTIVLCYPRFEKRNLRNSINFFLAKGFCHCPICRLAGSRIAPPEKRLHGRPSYVTRSSAVKPRQLLWSPYVGHVQKSQSSRDQSLDNASAGDVRWPSGGRKRAVVSKLRSAIQKIIMEFSGLYWGEMWGERFALLLRSVDQR